jgi:hypothetical protein
MKKCFHVFLLLISICLFGAYSCKKAENKDEEKEESGYKCINNECKLVEEGREYLTLADCQLGCTKKPGAAQFNLKGNTMGPATFEATLTLYNTTGDIANNNHFDQKTFYENNGGLNVFKDFAFTHTKADLAPATYHYKLVYKKYNNTAIRSEAFAVEAGKTTTVNFDL